MDKAMQTMIDNLYKNTGKSIEEWMQIVRSAKFEKHGQAVNFLKSTHQLGHGYANMIVHMAAQAEAPAAISSDEQIDQQYKGKEELKPIYDLLLKEVLAFGNDIEIAPKKAYVSLRRKKQFAMLQPASKTRFEIGINLKGQEPAGILEAVPGTNTMCSHRIRLQSADQVNDEVIGWIKKAYELAG